MEDIKWCFAKEWSDVTHVTSSQPKVVHYWTAAVLHPTRWEDLTILTALGMRVGEQSDMCKYSSKYG